MPVPLEIPSISWLSFSLPPRLTIFHLVNRIFDFKMASHYDDKKQNDESYAMDPVVGQPTIGKNGEYDEPVDYEPATAQASGLHRQLKSRHIQMISIGGVIGTGLFLGTASALANGGVSERKSPHLYFIFSKLRSFLILQLGSSLSSN